MGLIILLLVCHYLADFTPLVTARMLEAKKTGRGRKNIVEIFWHAWTHAGLMLVALLLLRTLQRTEGNLYLLNVCIAAILQLVSHFTIDLVKARYVKAKFNDATRRPYWVV